MAQILDEYRGFGNALGTGLGQGLSTGLQQLADMKFKSMSERENAKKVAKAYAGFGIPEGISEALSLLSPEERKYPLQNLESLIKLSGSGGQAKQAQTGMKALNSAQPQPAPQQEQQQQPRGSAADFLGANSSASPLIRQALANAPIQSQGGQGNGQEAAPAKEQSPGKEQLATALQRQPPSPEDQAALVADVFTSPEEKRKRRQEELAERRFEQQERKIAQQEKAERFKATKAERKEILDNAKVARNDLRDIERMQELEDSGNLDTPGYVEFLKRSGLDIPALMNPESEEFQKIQLSFLRNAKSYYGGRVSNFEVEQFLKTIPSLSQSPEGRKRVFANLKYLKRGEIAYKDSLMEVMKENNNVPPYDLLEQVEERIGPKLDKLAEKFKQELAKPVPKGQNKFITALQAGAGSLLGAVGGKAKSAVKGGAIGALSGFGAGPGALLGGGLNL